MDVSIVIVNFNTTALTLACVTSVYQYTLKNSFEVIILDNASSDHSVAAVQQYFPNVKIIYNTTNLGFGKANNQGINMANGKYVFLLNSDAALTSDAIATFFAYLEQPDNHRVAGCGGALINQDGSGQVSYGNFPSLLEAVFSLGLKTLYPRYYAKHVSSGIKVWQQEPFKVDYLSGAALFIRKEVLTETGCFDEAFFLYFEETELAFRMQKKGYTQMLLPDVKIIHLEGGSAVAGQSRLKSQTFLDSRYLFFKKCYGTVPALLMKYIYQIRETMSVMVLNIKKSI